MFKRIVNIYPYPLISFIYDRLIEKEDNKTQLLLERAALDVHNYHDWEFTLVSFD
ncbi:hypothetical protein [Niallia endozanthoxylica]|uniref:hypothetical protein n=1 Tax=Niallia endozanthoxylica TaxID=2036016 RepID=UPI00168AC479|nr:hypothetical protein [Niallia endozanthoxylica]